ncbi:MAG: type III-B CRISPR module-associated protein Cmr5 [Armatimonadetes bacterium]|nr:type III-B CRISPR module-associated protein Cmr5 [Armatimonadota bacterium]MDW8121930.1 type III-B CRISPR module-associated protein Cmr5 [Armatimonadota bacterium]
MSARKTLEQQRAKHAWDAIQKLLKSLEKDQKLSKEDKGAYAALAQKIPTLILTNGLGQTLAFLKSKKDNPHQWLLCHLSEWTLRQVDPNASQQDLLEWVLEHDSNAYRRATVEALAYLTWLKRFAEAELKVEGSE